MRRPIALPAAIFLAISTGHLSAQQQPTFRSKTELVIVDAVVVDKDGNAVRGLKASDFALTDRKKPQTISTFEEVLHAHPANAIAAPALPPTLKLDVASNMTVQADRLVMVFIDDLHIWQGRTDKAKALANDIVAKLGPQASMAMVFSSGEGSTEVTQDRSTLLTAIEGMKARQTFRRPHQGFVKQGPGFIDPEAPAEVRFDAMNEAAKASLKDLNDNQQYLEMLRRAATMLIHEGGRRKAFVAITEGMSADFSSLGGDGALLSNIGSSDSNLDSNRGSQVLRALMDALARANVTFYAIDPRGKVRSEDMMLESWPPPDCAVCNNPPLQLAPNQRAQNREDSQFAWENPVRMAQAGLGFMSEAAGGFAVTDSDDLTGGLGRILEDLDHYYLLGFYPAEVGGNDTHPVGLTVRGHPDYKVRFRRGYTSDAPSKPLKSKDPLAELATGVMPKSDLPLRLTAMPLPDGGKTVSVAVALEVTAPVGLLKESDSKLRDDVSYSVMVVDEKRAKVTQRTGRSASFSLSASDPGKATPDTVTYQIPLTIDLPPGRYQLRTSAMSKKLNKGGSVYLDLTVPDFSKMPLALTTIALGFDGGPRVPVGRTIPLGGSIFVNPTTQTRGAPMGPTVPSNPFGQQPQAIPPAQARAHNSKNPLPFEPTLAREFTRQDVLRSYFEVARQDSMSTVALEIRVLDSNNVAQLQYDRIVAPREERGVQLRIPLDKLSPGAFTLRITGSDGRNTTKTETGFIVKEPQG